MSVPVTRRRQATAELLHQVAEIEKDNPDAALRFLDAFERACAQLAEQPEMAPRYESENPRLADVRRWVIPDFPGYLIFYHYDGTQISILHLFSAKQDYDSRLRGEPKD